MGSGSAGKEGGPFKALLRQQTQSALEQRVRVTQHFFLFLHCRYGFVFLYSCVLKLPKVTFDHICNAAVLVIDCI